MTTVYVVSLILGALCLGEISAHDYSVFHDAECAGNNMDGETPGNKYAGMATCDTIAYCAGFVLTENSTGEFFQLKKRCELDEITTHYGYKVYRNMDFVPTEPPPTEETQPEEEDVDDEDTETAGNCEFSVGWFHSLYGHKDRSLGEKTLQQCLGACAVDEQCQSVTHNFVAGNCFISYASKDTHPEDYRRHNLKNYYQKDSCQEEGSADDGCLTESGPFGGYGGDAFSDEEVFELDSGRISKIKIHHGYSIDCIQVTYGRKEEAVKGPCHGGSGGEVSVIRLKKNEYVTRVEGWYGEVVDTLTFITNRNSYGPYGRGTDNSFTATGNGRLAYISGRAGGLLDQLSFHFYCE